MSSSNESSPEVRERAVRLVLEHQAGPMTRSGPRAGRLRRSSTARARRCAGGSGRASTTRGDERGRGAPSVSGSRRRRGRIASCDGRARFLARPRRISPRRSSTADPGHEGAHRRAPGQYEVEPLRRERPLAPSTYYEGQAPASGPAPVAGTCPSRCAASRAHRSGVALGGGRRASGCDAIRKHAGDDLRSLQVRAVPAIRSR